jgi:hypothetical protein
MLRRVTLPPFGNTIIDATIPFSVTLIMSQFVLLLFYCQTSKMYREQGRQTEVYNAKQVWALVVYDAAG